MMLFLITTTVFVVCWIYRAVRNDIDRREAIVARYWSDEN